FTLRPPPTSTLFPYTTLFRSARADELARRWAVALIVSLPLDRIGEIPLQSFAREAPALCAQVVRALVSDAELERITAPPRESARDRKSTRLNSSHSQISYAVF